MGDAIAATVAATPPVPQESIFEWADTFLHSMQFQELWVFIFVGFVGVFVNFLKKKLSKEAEGSFYNYLVGDHPASTVTALSTFFGAALTFVFSGTIDSASWPTIISLAFTTGLAVDASLNKASKPEIKSN